MFRVRQGGKSSPSRRTEVHGRHEDGAPVPRMPRQGSRQGHGADGSPRASGTGSGTQEGQAVGRIEAGMEMEGQRRAGDRHPSDEDGGQEDHAHRRDHRAVPTHDLQGVAEVRLTVAWRWCRGQAVCGGCCPKRKTEILESKTESPGDRFHPPGLLVAQTVAVLSMEPQMKTLHLQALFPCTSHTKGNRHGMALSQPPQPAGAADQRQSRVSPGRDRGRRRSSCSPHPHQGQKEPRYARAGVARPPSWKAEVVEKAPADSI